MKILVVKDGAVGDGLLFAPALDALARLHPGARVHLVGAPWRLRLLVAAGLAERTWATSQLEQFLAGAGPADAFADADEVVLFAFEADPPYARELARRVRGRVVVRPHFPEPGSGVHVADHVHAAFGHLGLSPRADRSYVLPVAGDQVRWATDFLGAGPRPALYVHPGTKIETKRWPAGRFVEVARRLSAEGWRILIGRGPMDEEVNRPIEEALSRAPGVASAAGHDLGRTAGLLRTVDAYLGVDSGVTHLSALVGCPTVAIYGSTRPATWGPIGRSVRVLAGSRGRPCCASDHPRDCEGGCMETIEVEPVLTALRESVRSGGRGSSG